MKKCRIHGIQPVKSVAVRWLGAFGKAGSMEDLARFESCPKREVACEITPLGKESKIHHARVGLLVDQKDTVLVRAYAGDSWTEKKGDRLLAKRSNAYVRTWSEAGGLYKLSQRNWGGKYVEGTIRNPHYSAVVIKDETEAALKFAEELADAMNLPVLNYYSAQAEEEQNA